MPKAVKDALKGSSYWRDWLRLSERAKRLGFKGRDANWALRTIPTFRAIIWKYDDVPQLEEWSDEDLLALCGNDVAILEESDRQARSTIDKPAVTKKEALKAAKQEAIDNPEIVDDVNIEQTIKKFSGPDHVSYTDEVMWVASALNLSRPANAPSRAAINLWYWARENQEKFWATTYSKAAPTKTERKKEEVRKADPSMDLVAEHLAGNWGLDGDAS